VNIVLDNLDILFRNIIAVGILFLVTVIIGKKLISQLNFFDFIVGITIGSIAAVYYGRIRPRMRQNKATVLIK